MSLIFDCLDNGIEFTVIDGIVGRGCRQFLTEVRHRLSPLTEHTADVGTRFYTANLEGLCKIWEMEDGHCKYAVLESSEYLSLFESLVKSRLLETISEGCRDVTEMGHESPVKECQLMEAMYVIEQGRLWPFYDDFDLV